MNQELLQAKEKIKALPSVFSLAPKQLLLKLTKRKGAFLHHYDKKKSLEPHELPTSEFMAGHILSEADTTRNVKRHSTQVT